MKKKKTHERTGTDTLGSNIESAIWGVNWENCGNMLLYNTSLLSKPL